MSDVNQLNLFGLDLSGIYRRAMLGIQQVLWSDEVGLRTWFAPAVAIYRLEDIDETANVAPEGSEGGLQVLLPDSQVLVTRLTLPASAEIFLDEAVTAHVHSHSPFASEETCWGSKIIDRSGGSLAVEIIIVARATAEAAVLACRQWLGPIEVPFGLSVETGDAYIALDGYQDARLDGPYLRNLKHFALRLVAGSAGIAFLAVIPVIWSMQTAQQYGELMYETEQRSAEVVKVREALVEAQGRVSEAEKFFSAHLTYRPWLHKVAAITPDAVYLNRLSIKNELLTVSGLAVNAADYQAGLAEAGLFTDVTAPAAFTLDKRSNRERFTLTMELTSQGDQ